MLCRETQHESKNLANEGFLIGKLWSVRHNKQNYHSHDYSSHREMRSVPGSCRKIQEARNVSGIYHIYPEYASKPFMVICDMELRGGGWTYILNRYEGSQDFYLNWDEYKQGFGNLAGEFWLGLEHIYEMTGKVLNLHKDLSRYNNNSLQISKWRPLCCSENFTEMANCCNLTTK